MTRLLREPRTSCATGPRSAFLFRPVVLRPGLPSDRELLTHRPCACHQTMNPIYLMASTPAGFSYGYDDFAATQNGWLACCASPFLLNQPGGGPSRTSVVFYVNECRWETRRCLCHPLF